MHRPVHNGSPRVRFRLPTAAAPNNKNNDPSAVLGVAHHHTIGSPGRRPCQRSEPDDDELRSCILSMIRRYLRELTPTNLWSTNSKGHVGSRRKVESALEALRLSNEIADVRDKRPGDTRKRDVLTIPGMEAHEP